MLVYIKWNNTCYKLLPVLHLHHDAISYRDLLDLPRVGDDLLHDLHGLPLGLSRLSLTLCRCSLDDLYLLALAHLHGHRCALLGGVGGRGREAVRAAKEDSVVALIHQPVEAWFVSHAEQEAGNH